ncbi:MAG: DMT family transporter [Endozoicomonas sp.]|uniref:DMT family transporter n=1 Tax=Endozoicomonas sp. TaxID=1892382 RepID=UPI003D9BAD2B
MQTENIPKGVAYALATAVVASTAGAASKLISGDVPVPVIVLAQYFICLVLMLPWLLKRSVQSLKTDRWGAHLVRGVTGWLCFYAYYQALAYIPLVEATLLRNTGPLFVPLVVWLWLKFQVPGKAWGPMLLGFAGVLLILKPDFDGISIWHWVGLTSGLFLAFSMVGTRALSSTEPSSRIMFHYFLISFVCSLPMAIMYWKAIPLWTLPYLLYVGGSICITMWLYTQAYTWARASVVAPVNYCGVVFAGLLGWWGWGHIPDTLAFAGMALVILAGLLSIFINSQSNRKAEMSASGEQSKQSASS